ncbi:MAG: hypothetical protein CMJ64_13510, partial [Planctomycetaceae bacterium]|nr:hypothetical protein [Planctomycetaceae bacterium]
MSWQAPFADLKRQFEDAANQGANARVLIVWFTNFDRRHDFHAEISAGLRDPVGSVNQALSHYRKGTLCHSKQLEAFPGKV